MKLSRNGDAVSQKILKDAAFLSRDHDFEPDQDTGTQNGADCKSCEPLKGHNIIGISWKKP